MKEIDRILLRDVVYQLLQTNYIALLGQHDSEVNRFVDSLLNCEPSVSGMKFIAVQLSQAVEDGDELKITFLNRLRQVSDHVPPQGKLKHGLIQYLNEHKNMSAGYQLEAGLDWLGMNAEVNYLVIVLRGLARIKRGALESFLQLLHDYEQNIRTPGGAGFRLRFVVEGDEKLWRLCYDRVDNMSPFSIAKRIFLDGFSVEELQTVLGSVEDAIKLSQITKGVPSLVREVLSSSNNLDDLTQLFGVLTDRWSSLPTASKEILKSLVRGAAKFPHQCGFDERCTSIVAEYNGSLLATPWLEAFWQGFLRREQYSMNWRSPIHYTYVAHKAGIKPDTSSDLVLSIAYTSRISHLETLLNNTSTQEGHLMTLSNPYQDLKKQFPEADVLLVTATDVETQAVLGAFSKPKLCHFGNQAYHDLGILETARIFMVQSEMGSGGQSGSILTIQEAIDTLHPSAVVMVGIAFGIDQNKRHVGDILVSRQLLLYDLQRVGTSPRGKMIISLRGDRPSASPRMLSIFRGAANYWRESSKVHFGLVLSGDKLVDNQDFRDQLIGLGLDTIGGEMEGAGLYATAERKKVDWILVKAICDWADGHKNQQEESLIQKEAAGNATRFLIHVIEKGGFGKSKTQVCLSNSVHNEPLLNQGVQIGLHNNILNQNIQVEGAIYPSITFQQKSEAKDFDVFLCYNGVDRAVVKKIGESLKEHDILPWLDEWELRPGLPWQRTLEQQIHTVKSVAIFVGKDELGRWHRSEMEAFLREFQKRNCPVIPVFLPNVADGQDLPVFLEGMSWIDFRKQEPDPLEMLIWGITGKRRYI